MIYFYEIEGLYREGEELIADYCMASYYYTRNIIKGRFRFGEEAIKRDSRTWKCYKSFLKNKEIEI